MRADKRLTESQIADIIRQILGIVKYLTVDYVKKRKSIFENEDQIGAKPIYRDLKIENFIVDPESLKIKVN